MIRGLGSGLKREGLNAHVAELLCCALGQVTLVSCCLIPSRQIMSISRLNVGQLNPVMDLHAIWG